MVCPPCCEAGHLNADANRVYDEVSAEWLYARAMEKHGECHYRDCSCAHMVGKLINENRR